jgi:hypothetical protein
MNINRRGNLEFSWTTLGESPETLFQIFNKLHFLPTFTYKREDSIVYRGICPEFREVPVGEMEPTYSLRETIIEGESGEVVTWVVEEDSKNEKEFEDLYRKYVLRNLEDNYFIGDSNFYGYNVIKREWAQRFTKEEAMKFINKNQGKFVIEDAK